MMVHQCRVQCHTMDSKTAESLGIEDDGKWMPFIFTMDMIDAAKLTSDEEGAFVYNCTTIFTNTGDTYIIDTPYLEFFKKFAEYNSLRIIFKEDTGLPPSEDTSEDDDLEL